MAALTKANLYLSFEGVSIPALSIPLDECGKFAISPLKWLRFIGYAIFGREGFLSTSDAGPEIDEYTANIESRSYYYISEDEPRLVDFKAMNDRTSGASALTVHQASFRDRVIERDGTCVITGDIARMCIACHIFPHSKGDNYIVNALRHRGAQEYPVDDWDGINDVRNGLLMIAQLHETFGEGDSAFLQTPNFCMNVDDVPFNQPRRNGEESPACRITLYHFIDAIGVVMNQLAPNNSEARLPQDTTYWPPAVILDQVYAAAVMQAWDDKTFLKYGRKRSKDNYYNNLEDDVEEEGDDHASRPELDRIDMPGASDSRTPGRSERYFLRSKTKAPTSQRTGQPRKRPFNDYLLIVAALWMDSSREARSKREHTGAPDVVRNKDVSAWLQSVEESRGDNESPEGDGPNAG